MKQKSNKTDRLIALGIFIPTAIVLGLAMYLKPDPSGMGTHQQLGLSPCGFLEYTALPCPMCGMTTTFTHLAHLQIVEGVLNQPFGLVLFLLTLFSCVVSFVELFFPRRRISRFLNWLGPYEFRLALFFFVGMILGWIYKIIVVLY
ncbi:MAG: DUF2752 domain-containing protein [Myxococcota bacterium]|nr:DUF2752 domain-containing protein [Myxococcota bacterium]